MEGRAGMAGREPFSTKCLRKGAAIAALVQPVQILEGVGTFP